MHAKKLYLLSQTCFFFHTVYLISVRTFTLVINKIQSFASGFLKQWNSKILLTETSKKRYSMLCTKTSKKDILLPMLNLQL